MSVATIRTNDSDSIDDIVEMEQIFATQKEAYLTQPEWDMVERKKRLILFKAAFLANKEALVTAVSEDYGHRSRHDTLYADILPTTAQFNYTLARLAKWMKPTRRSPGLLLAPASVTVHYQPVGVVGIVVPWNFPINLAVMPLITSIAAGNRAMLKMSEFTPKTNQVLKQIITSVFDSKDVCIVEGEMALSAAFTKLPFDHLLFTGSTVVGKHVMRAAADNLTPVTLELGGKSPVVVAPDIDIKMAVNRILLGKSLNAGQICIAPDYILCPRAKVMEFVKEYRNEFNRRYPTAMQNDDYTNIVDARQYARLKSWLEDAQQKGAKVETMQDGCSLDDQRHRMLPHLLLDVSDDMQLMQDEIFGPLLPILPYDSIDDAIRYIKARPHPLALYIMSFDSYTQKKIIRETISGGVAINDTIMHFAADDAPFGGVGPSGMGQYHGIEGFRTFSKSKTILKQGKFHSTRFIYAPYGSLIQKIILKFFLR
ncbi:MULTISPECIES: coniferyl aldehyde dehydrogenase [unclassified Moritella]|uniref:coniferyl aldehyde dehydrogenase n=1 Tax=unclassified Moritella TaxID=2637987 RepID=UPI001BAAEBE3|nr:MULTISPECIES: coniferyl aldehyde dehydrogenase [unclassified Moritella]QUM87031.1 coniferyl aldehyde dehydrogenase [Moritella sp. 28]QUM91267.1 coniferyl aldehyde dehydrogenase [Moritella sp. 36]